jgi:hypothetical protein
MPVVLSLLACRDDATDSGTTAAEPVDLSAPVPAGQARAGRLVDDAPAFGGISAEARPGDVMLVNAVARFVVQDVRPGSWYIVDGGGVIDADVVRPDGALGRDAIEEWSSMFGLGRLLIPERVEVVNDGTDGGDAVVRVTGYDGAMGLVEGALEAPGFIQELHLEIVTEYHLPPDSHLLEVTTTATATTDDATFAVGDVVLGANEVLRPFAPGTGFGQDDQQARPWTAYVSDRSDVAYVLAAPAGETLSVSGYSLLTELASMLVGFSSDRTVTAGESTSWTRWWGVGPDLATLTTEVLAARGEDTQEVAGTVTAPDGPVAGARVVVDLAGRPYTLAVTGADGSFAARVPPGATTTLVDGRGTGLFTDLPVGAAPVSPYAAPAPTAAALEALRSGATEVPAARGRGVSAPGSLTLGEPGQVKVRVLDGLPFAARLSPTVPDGPTDTARVQSRPDGLQAAGWARDGEVVLHVEPGTYELLVHRGPRWEYHSERVTVAAGGVASVDTALARVLAPEGWVLGDPHEHASPSPDGSIPMEDRLVLAAAHGLQVHFGTDHDNLADYRPLLAPLGLDGILRSIVSDEVSPPLRGHFNIYPVDPVVGAANNGAWSWWQEVPASTDAMATRLRELHGDGFVLQSNHPLDSGMGSSSGWTPGDVGDRDYWTDQIQAMEVMNSGGVGEYLDLWTDIVLRGGRVTPVGVSDAHSYFDGKFGFSATWIHVGDQELTDDAIADAFRAGAVMPTNGPFVASSILPGQVVDAGTVVRLTATGASFVSVDRIRWFEDGVEVEVVPARSAARTLAPARDALVYAIVEGDTPMSPLSGLTPWALVGPWRVDVDGDGWDPPLPAFP